MGEPGSPILPPAGGAGRAAPSRRGMGKPGFPRPPPAGEAGRAAPSRRGLGKPGFPRPPPAGGSGRAPPSYEDRTLPHPPPAGEETGLLPPAGGGWEGGNPVSPSLCGCGPEARAPGPRPMGGSGRAPPSHEQPMVSRRGAAEPHRLIPFPVEHSAFVEVLDRTVTPCKAIHNPTSAIQNGMKWPYDAPACWPRKPGSLTPRYASSTRGWRCTSSGGPSAIRAP